MIHKVRRTRESAHDPRAFTLVEMLVVVALIIILLSLLIVGLNRATRTAQASNTKALMQTISQGLVQFKKDMGYYPPVLDDRRVLGEGPILGGAFGTPQYELEIQNWHSRTSIGEFLIGYGDNRTDGYGSTALGEVPFTGIRHPGRGGAWGAGPDEPLTARNPVNTGKVFGPYIELDDDRLLGALDEDGIVRFPGDAKYKEPKDDGTFAKVLVDHWGEPIQYFRRNYPPGALGQSYRSTVPVAGGAATIVPTLSDVIVLRPYTIAEGAGSTVRIELKDMGGDVSSSVRLDTAEFALLSKGPDRATDPEFRVDLEEKNKDNIIEVGP